MNRFPSLSLRRRRLNVIFAMALPMGAVLTTIPLEASTAGASVSPCQNGTYTSLYFCSIPDTVTFDVTVAGGGGGGGGFGEGEQVGGPGGGGTIQTATMTASAGDGITVSPGTGGGDSLGAVSDPSGVGGNGGTADGGQGGSTLAGESGGGGGGGGYSEISDSTTAASITSGGGGGGGGGGRDDGITSGGAGGYNGGDGSTADGGAGGTGGGSGSAQGGAGNPGQLTVATSENPAGGGYSAGGGGGGGGCLGGTGGSPGGTNASAGGGGGGTSCSSGNVSDVETEGPTNIGNGYVTISGLPSPGAPTAVVNDINGSAPTEGATYVQYQAVLTSFSCSEGTNSEWSLGLSDCFDASGNAATNGSPGPLSDSDEIGNLDTQSLGNGLTYNACATSFDSGTSQVCSTTYTYNVVATLPSAGPPSVTSLDFNGSAATDGMTFYEGESVTTSFTCAEATDGPGLTECSDGTTGSVSGPTGSGSNTLPTGTPGANESYTVTVESSDGQSAFDTITYSVAAPPIAQITTVNGGLPIPDSTYYAGEVIPVSYGCNEGAFGTGLVSCNGIDSTGFLLDGGTVGLGDGYLFTSGVGDDKFVATATSSDGGVGEHAFFYTVAALPSVTSIKFNGSAATDGVTFYQGESVSTSFTCAEGTFGTGLASCNDASGGVGTITGTGASSTGSGGGTISTSTVGQNYSYTVNVASTDGATASLSVTYNVAALPTATISVPGNNQKFNLGQVVPTSFSCTEGTDGPGLASCTDGVTGSVSGLAGSGTGTLPTGSVGPHTYTVTVTSDDGATSTATINYIVVGPPTAKINFPATGLTFNQHQLVAAGFSCAEAINGPGIRSCVDSNGSPFGFGVLNTSTPGAHTYTVTATSKDGQVGTATITYTVVGPPTAAISLPLNNQKFNLHQVVSTTFACAEAANGPGIKSCTDLGGANSPHGTLNTSTPGVHTYTVIAISKDGQVGTATITYTVVGPPIATIFSPGNNGRYVQNQVVPTTFGCAEAFNGPGISSCTDSGGASAPHGKLSTSTLGFHTYTVTATSVDGQTGAVTISYTVIK